MPPTRDGSLFEVGKPRIWFVVTAMLLQHGPVRGIVSLESLTLLRRHCVEISKDDPREAVVRDGGQAG